MFKSVSDKKNKIDGNQTSGPTDAQLDQDLIVHNMPNRDRLSKSTFTSNNNNSSINNSGFLKSGVKNNGKNDFKKVGLIIIILGVALVAALFYFGYRFLIKPQAEPASFVADNQLTNINNVTSNDLISESISINEENEISPIDSIPIEEVTPDIFVPETIETNTTTPVMTETEDDVIQEVPEALPVLDFDSDGLTNDEEEALNTNLDIPDSDEDGYLDLAEILNGYDPLGPGSLAGSRFITRYQNTVGNYSILYPATWDLRALNNNFTIMISAPDNSLMQISTQDNSKIQNITSWYEETFPEEFNAYERLIQGKNWEGIMGENGLNFYLTDSTRKNIYVISYIPIISGRLAYPNIFQMMINSFTIF